MVIGFATLFVLSALGEWLVHWLHLPLPGGLMGMVVLLVFLLVRPRPRPQLQAASQALLQNMMLLFIPLVTGVVDQVEQLQSHWLVFVGACIGGSLITLAITAWVFAAMLKWQKAKVACADEAPRSPRA